MEVRTDFCFACAVDTMQPSAAASPAFIPPNTPAGRVKISACCCDLQTSQILTGALESKLLSVQGMQQAVESLVYCGEEILCLSLLDGPIMGPIGQDCPTSFACYVMQCPIQRSSQAFKGVQINQKS